MPRPTSLSDSWTGILPECVSAAAALERAETARLAPLLKEAGIAGQNNRGAFLKERKQSGGFFESDEEDGRRTQRAEFDAWFDRAAAARVAFCNTHKDPLLVAFSAAVTKSFCSLYGIKSGERKAASAEDAVARLLRPAAKPLAGLAAARPGDQRLAALSARLSALAGSDARAANAPSVPAP